MKKKIFSFISLAIFCPLLILYILTNVLYVNLAPLLHETKLEVKAFNKNTNATIQSVEIHLAPPPTCNNFRVIGLTNKLGILYYKQHLLIREVKWVKPFIGKLPTFSNWKVMLKTNGYKEKEVLIPSYSGEEFTLIVTLEPKVE